MAGNAP